MKFFKKIRQIIYRNNYSGLGVLKKHKTSYLIRKIQFFHKNKILLIKIYEKIHKLCELKLQSHTN